MSKPLSNQMKSLFEVNKLNKKKTKIVENINKLQVQRVEIETVINNILIENGILGATSVVLPATNVISTIQTRKNRSPILDSIIDVVRKGNGLTIAEISRQVQRSYPQVYQTIMGRPEFIRQDKLIFLAPTNHES